MRLVSLFALTCGFLLVASACCADSIAIVPGTGGRENDHWNNNATIGYDFTLTTSVTVTALGFFDANGASGPADSYPIGLWYGNHTLLASATVPAGAPPVLIDGFDFVSISPVVLAPGVYAIGAYGLLISTDQFEFAESGSTTISGLTLGAAVETIGTGLMYPWWTESFATQGYFGPDFLVAAPADAPEPSTLSLAALALGLIAYYSMRRRNPETR